MGRIVIKGIKHSFFSCPAVPCQQQGRVDSKWRQPGLGPLSPYPSACVQSVWGALWGSQGFEPVAAEPDSLPLLYWPQSLPRP